MASQNKFSPEVRERAVRLVLEQLGQHESQWAAIVSVGAKIGCSAETLRKWVRQAERDTGRREGPSTADRDRLKQLEHLIRTEQLDKELFWRVQPTSGIAQ